LWTILARNRRERLISLVSLVSDQTARRELQGARAAVGETPETGVAPRVSG
jgi:hypothetical protein